MRRVIAISPQFPPSPPRPTPPHHRQYTITYFGAGNRGCSSRTSSTSSSLSLSLSRRVSFLSLSPLPHLPPSHLFSFPITIPLQLFAPAVTSRNYLLPRPREFATCVRLCRLVCNCAGNATHFRVRVGSKRECVINKHANGKSERAIDYT